ncbi:SH3-domain-containing protein [Phlegmacium glaucopus]|nr:SH3-domain-containing protein [Phlegmacium glaucopus]
MSPTVDQTTEYIVAQTKKNIQFLHSINQISSEDARQIISKLPGPDYNLENSSRSPSPFSIRVGANSPSIPPRLGGASNYRALWGYNEDGQEAEDLTFNEGEVIQVIDQTNSDWWRGRLNGREGLFPSSYVERVPDTPQPHLRPPPPIPRQHGNFPSFPTGPHPYPQQPQYFGPPPGNMYPPNPMPSQGGPRPYLVGHPGPPPQQGPPQGHVVVVNTEQPPKKQGLLSGNLGNTLAHSAVGGVGFGAGSAIGGGIINSLF